MKKESWELNTWQLREFLCKALVSPTTWSAFRLRNLYLRPRRPRLPRLRPFQPAIVLQPLLSTSKAFRATMALQLLHTTSHLPAFSGLRAAPSVPQVNNKVSRVGCVRRRSGLQSINSVLNPMDDPILKEAIKEPVAFLGGIFAGLLRLDLNEEPLKDWVAKTAEAAGIDLDESQDFDTEDSIPEDIRID